MKKNTISNDELIYEVELFEEGFQDFLMSLNRISPNINYVEIVEKIDLLVQELKSKLKNNSAFYEYEEYVIKKIRTAKDFLNQNVDLLNIRKDEDGVYVYNLSKEIGIKIVDNFNYIFTIFNSLEKKLEPITLSEIYLKRIDLILDLRKALASLRKREKIIGKIDEVLNVLNHDKHILYVNIEDIKDAINDIGEFNSSMFPSEIMQSGEFLDKFLNKIKDRKYDLNNINGNVNSSYYEMYRFYKLRSNIFDESYKIESILKGIKNNFINETKSIIDNNEKKIKDCDNNMKKLMDSLSEKSDIILNETNIAEIRLQEVDSKVLTIRSQINGEIDNIKGEAKVYIDKVIDDVKQSSVNSLDVLIENIQNIDKEIEGYKELVSDKTTEQLTSVYKKEAKWEKRAYYTFSIIGLLIIAFAIYYSAISLADFHDRLVKNKLVINNNELKYLGIRLIFSLIIFSAVAYTSRLASRSYTFWKKNEGIYLRLTALKPFISAMPPEKKIEIHEKLVDVYFGKDDQDQNLNQKIQDLPNNITQLLGKVVDQTSGVIDSAKGNKIIKPPVENNNG